MRWLVFDLAGALASFGGPAPGSIRSTERGPTRSALLGVLAAACGIRREDTAHLQQLSDSVRFASRVSRSRAPLLRDYQTAQAAKAAALKGRPLHSRRDEASVGSDALSTVLSDRYYLGDFAATIVVGCEEDATFGPELLAERLRQPRFVLYLGRKSCAPQWPMAPQLFDADYWHDALSLRDAAQHARQTQFEQWARSSGSRQARQLAFAARPPDEPWFAWDTRLTFDAARFPERRLVRRRDQPTDRGPSWRFSERDEWLSEHMEAAA